MGAVTALVLSSGLWSQLTTIGLSFQPVETGEEVKAFLELLAGNCTKLTGLELNMRRPTVNENSSIVFDTIRPLLVLNLKSLSVAQNRRFLLTVQVVREMAEAWPDLRKLYLGADPDEPLAGSRRSKGTSMKVIEALARHLPGLEELGMFWNTSELPTLTRKLARSPQFHGDLLLDVGFSRLPEGSASLVGFYLGNICGPKMRIRAGRSPWTSTTRAAPADFSKSETRWNEAETLARLVAESRETLTGS